MTTQGVPLVVSLRITDDPTDVGLLCDKATALTHDKKNYSVFDPFNVIHPYLGLSITLLPPGLWSNHLSAPLCHDTFVF